MQRVALVIDCFQIELEFLENRKQRYSFTPSESINMILTFKSVDETVVCVTIQIKAIEQYFHVVHCAVCFSIVYERIFFYLSGSWFRKS